MKKTTIEGYSVCVFVDVRVDRSAGAALAEADAIRAAIRRHLGPAHRDVTRHAIDIGPQVSATCEHCGAFWTETSESYNGGCCAADEVDDMLRAMRRLEAAGVDRDYLIDTAKGLHDAASNVDGVCNREIDEADLDADPIDLSELDEYLAQLDRAA